MAFCLAITVKLITIGTYKVDLIIETTNTYFLLRNNGDKTIKARALIAF